MNESDRESRGSQQLPTVVYVLVPALILSAMAAPIGYMQGGPAVAGLYAAIFPVLFIALAIFDAAVKAVVRTIVKRRG